MVKLGFKKLSAIAALSLTLGASATLTGCSDSPFWGEDAPAPQFAVAPSGSECPPAMNVLEGSDAESAQALGCWTSQVGRLWIDIRGKTRNELTDNEIRTLFRKRIIVVEGDVDQTLEVLFAAKSLLGIRGNLSRETTESWVSWFGENRPRIRELYQRVKAHYTSNAYLAFSDIRGAVNLTASFLRKTRWSMRSSELADKTKPLVFKEYATLRESTPELARVLINLAEGLCPMAPGGDVWETTRLAECAEGLLSVLDPGAVWLEYALNPYYSHRLDAAERSLDALLPRLKMWLEDPRLRPVDMKLWVNFAEKIGVQVREQSLKNLDWINAFSPRSTATSIDPSFLVTAADIVYRWQKSVFQGLQWFRACDFRKAKDWENCTVELTPALEERSEVMNIASRLRNRHYSNRLLPFNRTTFSRLMLMDAISDKVMKVYDKDQNAFITIENLASNVELLDLLTASFQVQKNTQFIDQLSLRLKGIDISASQTQEWVLRSFEPEGVARLLTLMGEVLYRRDRKNQFFVDSIFANLSNLFPGNSTHLDQGALTGILATIDILGDYRRSFLSRDATLAEPMIVKSSASGETILRRGAVIKAIDPLLREHFPRLHQSCMNFGWERSCETVFMNLLAGKNDDDLIFASELDILPIASIFLENLIDRCDENNDGKLTEKIADGSDELDCGFTHLKDMVVRLMDAKIIEDQKSIRNALAFVNSTFLTRPLGKISLARGTRKGTLIRYIPRIFYNDRATMGSILGLAAEIIDPERIEMLDEQGFERHNRQLKRRSKN
jgi:hypothetical protein